MRKSYLFIIFYFLCAELPAAATATDPDCCTRCGNFWTAVYDLLLGEEPAAGPARVYALAPGAAAVAAAMLEGTDTRASTYSKNAVPPLSHGPPETKAIPAGAGAGSAVGFRPDHLPSAGVGKAGTYTLPTVASAGPGSMIYDALAEARLATTDEGKGSPIGARSGIATGPATATLYAVASARPEVLVFNGTGGVSSLADETKRVPVPNTGRVTGSGVTMGDLVSASGFSAASGGSATGSGFPYPGVQAHSSDGDIPTVAPTLPGTASDEPPPTGEGK